MTGRMNGFGANNIAVERARFALKNRYFVSQKTQVAVDNCLVENALDTLRKFVTTGIAA